MKGRRTVRRGMSIRTRIRNARAQYARIQPQGCLTPGATPVVFTRNLPGTSARIGASA